LFQSHFKKHKSYYNMKNEYKFPTEVISLPSKGLVYPTTSPLSSGQVTIKQMTAKEEDILASQNLIKKGVVLDKLFESIIMDNIDINEITIGDKNAILVATRLLGYGPEYHAEVTDPFTLEAQKVVIDLSKISVKEVDESLLNRENIYSFDLPRAGIPIEFKLLTHGDELAIQKDLQSLQRLNPNSSQEITTRLRYMIVSVDGNTDRGKINEFVSNQLPAIDSRELRKYVNKISPDLELKFEFESAITGEKEALDIPFGISFFYPS